YHRLPPRAFHRPSHIDKRRLLSLSSHILCPLQEGAFRPVTNFSIPTLVNISFTMSAILDVDEQLQLLSSFLWLEMVWLSPLLHPFIRWNPEECEGITKISVATKNLWLPDIFIVEFMDVDKTPKGLTAYISNEGRIRYKKPMKVASICSLDIFYFPFDQQNCTLTFSSFLYTVENMLLGMEKEVWEIADTSRDIVQTHGEWELLSINKATPKIYLGTSLYDQITFYVAIRCRPRLYIINLLLPSGFLIAIDVISFYLPAESGNHAPFKITLLLGYNVFLLMMNDLLSTSGTPLISVYFALCLSLMVVSLLETIFITYLLHLATTQPPPMPQWLHSLLLCCTKIKASASPLPTCLVRVQHCTHFLFPHSHFSAPVSFPVPLPPQVSGPREAELNGCPGSTRVQQEEETQKQHLVNLWVQFSHMMDTLLFCLYLLFTATSVVIVTILWNT
uniref:5-hydroxytryptamine receptor 3E n=1 Tax=Ailuropoda melanoleuca TaxID=9646 RepID=G1MG06_AILME